LAQANSIAQPPASLFDVNTELAVDALNKILADSFALYMKTKNFHWHVQGPQFREYHLMLDDQATEILGTTDQIAERVRKTGHSTLRSIGDIARYQRIKDSNSDSIAAPEMLAELYNDNVALVQALHEAKRLVDEAGDNATSGQLDDWTDLAEGRAWFLSATSRSS
jgi:starvation-inducible DNA-binding protein